MILKYFKYLWFANLFQIKVILLTIPQLNASILEFYSEIMILLYMCVLSLCVSSFFFLFFFFLSAFSLNGKGLSETKNFLYFQTVEFVVKKKDLM